MSEVSNRSVRWLVILMVALLAIVIAVMALMATTVHNGNDYDFGMMGSFGGSWWLMMLIPAVIIIAIVVVLLIGLSEHPAVHAPVYAQSPPPQMEPLAILDRRLASGEISVEEYTRLKNELTRH